MKKGLKYVITITVQIIACDVERIKITSKTIFQHDVMFDGTLENVIFLLKNISYELFDFYSLFLSWSINLIANF